MGKNFHISHIFLVVIFCFFVIFISCEESRSDQILNKTFLNAVTLKNYALMEELLKKGADINATYDDGEFTAFSSAAASGDIELVNFLLTNGANTKGNSKFPNSPIYLAITRNHPIVVKRLLDEGIDPNYAWVGEDSGTLLISAVQLGYLDVVKLLVKRGSDVNFTGNGNYSPLYRAIIYDRFEVFLY